MNRNDIILHSIDLTAGPGLELGPLTAPIVKKTQGEIYYADHASTEDLKIKYAKEPVVLDDIVNVDYVLGSGSIGAAVGSKKFKYVVAAHVIEHVPDTIRWLQDIASVLEPGGVLSLVIPNKQFTFDIARANTQAADLFDAYLEKRTKPSTRSMYDFASNYLMEIDPAEVWAAPKPYDYRAKPHRYTPEEAYAMCQENLNPDTYVDCHIHVFTPASFFEVLRELSLQNMLNFSVDYFFDTNENNLEFYVSLRKQPDPKKQQNLILASIPEIPSEPTVAELAAQVNSLQSELSSVLTSKAWRVTGPLRNAAHKIRESRKGRKG